MADKDKKDPSKDFDEVEDAMSEASNETAKVPDEDEAEPANVEGSEAQRP